MNTADPGVVFAELASKLRNEVGYTPSIYQMRRKEEYGALLLMEWQIVPFILLQLASKDDWPGWFALLRDITGFCPELAQDESRDRPAIAEAYVEWGRAHGYKLPYN
jgi:hypothetical protein